MKRQIMLAETQADYNFVGSMFSEGWELDTKYFDKMIHLDNAVVFPLVLYESEEERPKPIEEVKKVGLFEDVCDVISVEHSQVAEKFKEGYRVQELYAKSVTMVLRLEQKNAILKQKGLTEKGASQ